MRKLCDERRSIVSLFGISTMELRIRARPAEIKFFHAPLTSCRKRRRLNATLIFPFEASSMRSYSFGVDAVLIHTCTERVLFVNTPGTEHSYRCPSRPPRDPPRPLFRASRHETPCPRAAYPHLTPARISRPLATRYARCLLRNHATLLRSSRTASGTCPHAPWRTHVVTQAARARRVVQLGKRLCTLHAQLCTTCAKNFAQL